LSGKIGKYNFSKRVALLQTCQQIRREASGVFFAGNWFHITRGHNNDDAGFLEPLYAKYITRVVLAFRAPVGWDEQWVIPDRHHKTGQEDALQMCFWHATWAVRTAEALELRGVPAESIFIQWPEVERKEINKLVVNCHDRQEHALKHFKHARAKCQQIEDKSWKWVARCYAGPGRASLSTNQTMFAVLSKLLYEWKKP
jgi:hypothetical protein